VGWPWGSDSVPPVAGNENDQHPTQSKETQ